MAEFDFLNILEEDDKTSDEYRTEEEIVAELDGIGKEVNK